MSRYFLIFSIIILTNLDNVAVAQSPQQDYFKQNIEQRKFDDKKYNSLTEGVDYSEEKKEKKKKDRKEKGPVKFEGIGTFLKFFIITIGIVLLFFILIKALTGDNVFLPKDKKLKPVSNVDLEKIEDNLEEAELENPIKQAIAAGNYSMAIRLYYLTILKELSLQKKIKWKKDKTNGEYLRELAGSPFFKNIQQITLVFEKIWYGKAELNKEDFLLLQPKFKSALKDVNKIADRT